MSKLPEIEPTLAATDPAGMTDFNQILIAEFRDNRGCLSGQFAGVPVLLLNTVGAKSGQRRTTPLLYTRHGAQHILVASNAGAPKNPAWYHNLLANPIATVEVGADQLQVRSSVAHGEERDRLFEEAAGQLPNLDDYQRHTPRRLPVVVLAPAVS
jgi:deazaflavin-dependent oxidoreductase (nitroreductase family)